MYMTSNVARINEIVSELDAIDLRKPPLYVQLVATTGTHAYWNASDNSTLFELPTPTTISGDFMRVCLENCSTACHAVCPAHCQVRNRCLSTISH
eukprot:COSAG05_NODE_3082_length_2338_cov_1.901295_4_plen_95_part_00